MLVLIAMYQLVLVLGVKSCYSWFDRELPEQTLHANVRDSSGTMGTMYLASALSRNSTAPARTPSSRSSGAFEEPLECADRGDRQRLGRACAPAVTAELHSARTHVLALRRAVLQLHMRASSACRRAPGWRSDRGSGTKIDVHLLLVRDVLRLAGCPCRSLDRLCRSPSAGGG